ncbi:hypothetical protein EMCRGX_G019891 [Ephydatia muelleri]|eukprot:Em0011g128a
MASAMACFLRRRGLQTASILARRAYSTDSMTLTFSSPTEAFYKGVGVKQVDINTTSGSFGILPMHVPAVAVLKPGVVTVYDGDKTQKFFASSGAVTINADSSVQIIAEEAFPIDRLDAQAARQGLEKCQQELVSAGSEANKAAAQVGVELYEALLKALEH